jgi:hypothetical protein
MLTEPLAPNMRATLADRRSRLAVCLAPAAKS